MPRAKRNSAQIDLEDIAKGYPGLTSVAGSALLEACVVTLHNLGYKSGSRLTVKGSKTGEIDLYWNLKATASMLRTWKDQDEATEKAATCLSILLTLHFTGYSVVERSVKGTGIDYWLGKTKGDEKDPFKDKARLEVSGIFEDFNNALERRVTNKLRQTRQSDATRLPAIVSVIEFSRLQCKFVIRK